MPVQKPQVERLDRNGLLRGEEDGRDGGGEGIGDLVREGGDQAPSVEAAPGQVPNDDQHIEIALRPARPCTCAPWTWRNNVHNLLSVLKWR